MVAGAVGTVAGLKPLAISATDGAYKVSVQYEAGERIREQLKEYEWKWQHDGLALQIQNWLGEQRRGPAPREKRVIVPFDACNDGNEDWEEAKQQALTRAPSVLAHATVGEEPTLMLQYADLIDDKRKPELVMDSDGMVVGVAVPVHRWPTVMASEHRSVQVENDGMKFEIVPQQYSTKKAAWFVPPPKFRTSDIEKIWEQIQKTHQREQKSSVESEDEHESEGETEVEHAHDQVEREPPTAETQDPKVRKRDDRSPAEPERGTPTTHPHKKSCATQTPPAMHKGGAAQPPEGGQHQL